MTVFSRANDNVVEARGMEVGIVQISSLPDYWLVEAIDTGSEGEVYQTTFSGPMAERRARDYALRTYGTPFADTQISAST